MYRQIPILIGSEETNWPKTYLSKSNWSRSYWFKIHYIQRYWTKSLAGHAKDLSKTSPNLTTWPYWCCRFIYCHLHIWYCMGLIWFGSKIFIQYVFVPYTIPYTMPSLGWKKSPNDYNSGCSKAKLSNEQYDFLKQWKKKLVLL